MALDKAYLSLLSTASLRRSLTFSTSAPCVVSRWTLPGSFSGRWSRRARLQHRKLLPACRFDAFSSCLGAAPSLSSLTAALFRVPHALVCSTAEICLAFVAGFTGEVWCLHRPEGPVADAFYKPLAQALGPLAVRVSTGMPQVSWLAPPALQCRFEVLPLRRRGGGLLTSCSDGFP